MLAVAKGAKILERHVALPTEKYSINAYSMTPAQADKWVEAVIKARTICATKKENDKYVSQAEIDSLNSLMRGVYLKHDVKAGDTIGIDDVFFAMPCQEKQMNSGEFNDGIEVSRNYAANEALFETRHITSTKLARSVIHDAKGMLYEAGIVLGDDIEIELSHHYGMKNFRQTGAIIVSVINREYCKKILIVLPGQKHPMHMHKIKRKHSSFYMETLKLCSMEKKRSLRLVMFRRFFEDRNMHLHQEMVQYLKRFQQHIYAMIHIMMILK